MCLKVFQHDVSLSNSNRRFLSRCSYSRICLLISHWLLSTFEDSVNTWIMHLNFWISFCFSRSWSLSIFKSFSASPRCFKAFLSSRVAVCSLCCLVSLALVFALSWSVLRKVPSVSQTQWLDLHDTNARNEDHSTYIQFEKHVNVSLDVFPW